MPRKKQQYGLGSIFRKKVRDPITGELTETPRWYIQFYVDGRMYREATGTTVYNEAQKRLKQRIAEATTGHVPESNHKVLVGELLDMLQTDYEQHNTKSLKCFANSVIKRLRAVFGDLRVGKIQTKELKDFVSACLAEPLAPATVNRHLALLRRAYTLGTNHRPRKVTPAETPLFAPHFLDESGNVRRGFFEHSDYVKMRDALEGSERAALVFAYYSGCRMSEILNLRWDQVDFDARIVRLHAGETKSGDGRVLPMGATDSELFLMLAQQIARSCTSPWVFFRPNGDRVVTLRYGWADAVEATGVDRLFHDLRRTAVRNLIRSGVPESVAMAISGHKTRSVFSRYNVTNEADLHEAAAKQNAYIARQSGGPGPVCVACGQAMPGTAKFCPGCGAKVEG